MTSLLDTTTSELYILGVLNRGADAVTKIPDADAWADARRMFRWQSSLSGFVVVALFAIAMRQLGQADLDPSMRLPWLLLPIPGLAWAVWEATAHSRRRDEFERMVSARASEISWPLTIVWIGFVALLATAYGFPVPIPAPFGVPPDNFGWPEVLVVPLLIHLAAFTIVYKRYTGPR